MRVRGRGYQRSELAMLLLINKAITFVSAVGDRGGIEIYMLKTERPVSLVTCREETPRWIRKFPGTLERWAGIQDTRAQHRTIISFAGSMDCCFGEKLDFMGFVTRHTRCTFVERAVYEEFAPYPIEVVVRMKLDGLVFVFPVLVDLCMRQYEPQLDTNRILMERVA